ncbi:hypothetical protein OH802_06480 [Nocardioides sp. NBC_00850]|uniref:hypothetical protein n=1 Tax=Nocardioides sp. NBC_00850 TaxID=2976001 RepID=UPI0038656596|nr:hypothetical protein OH802_06480 [Nocardioides sp. NBC_00850]
MRPFSEAEQRILSRLLSVEFDGVQELRAQATHISGVEPNCTCGCPSITPTIDRSLAPPADGPRILPVELQELERPNGLERTVICFLDEDGYLANLECVFYDDAVDEWPEADECAALLRDSERYLNAVRLPSGAHVSPQDSGDHWVSFEIEQSGFSAATWSGWRETYSNSGELTARVFTK